LPAKFDPRSSIWIKKAEGCIVRIKKGDTVVLRVGRKQSEGGDKGRQGKVHQVFPDKEMVTVFGINIVTRHVRPRPQLKQAGKVEKEAPLHVSNLALVCNKCNKPTRVGYRRLADGKRARYCKQCGEVID